ncbi:HD domain-containing phosphohydrolase [Deinococcus sp. QL22]|uniref:HD domain-containing phosphohydrolase n=1 Tax=Deinococcus sp. QL22 TaxID=2939437 RepID=UPI0020182FB0|nr:HD domain-containing phosphohydrolase [Deinococcus sp. QL22]UQN08458.1 diguanylate cyclase [Deinococcus sp. QL22]
MTRQIRSLHRYDSGSPALSSLALRLEGLHSAATAFLNTDPKRALQLAREYSDLAQTIESLAVRASAEQLLGHALSVCGELPEALTRLRAAIHLFQEMADPLRQAGAEELAGKVCLNLGELDEANHLLQGAISRVGQLQTAAAKSTRATALNHLAGVQHSQGRAAEALASLRQALSIWEQQGQFVGQVHCLSNMGNIQTWLGQYPEAVGSLSQAYTIYQTHLNDPRSEAFILHNLARVHHLKGDHSLAVEVMQSACRSAESSQDHVLRTDTQLNLGTFYLELGQFLEARTHLETALSLSRQTSYRAGEMSTLDSLGLLAEQTGATAEAQQAYQQALEIALEIGDPQGELEARLHLGKLYLLQRTDVLAQAQLSTALDLAVQTQSPKEAAEIHDALVQLYEAQQDFQLALHHAAALRRIERELFNAESDRQTRNLSIQFEVERARHEATVYKLRTEVEHEARQAAERLVQERTSELSRAQHEVVTRLAMAAEYRDDTTGEHTRRVGRATTRIARALGWSERRAGVLGIAARLHDVGKIGIPDTVLLKPGKLSPEQYTQMQTHTLIGARILSGGRSELLRLAEEIALTHHERWDGGGYPRGLSGAQIPMSGRIVAIADVFDALTQARPYKRAWTLQEAIEEIQQQSGVHFDPSVVEAAVAVLNDPEANSSSEWMSLGASQASPDDLPLSQEEATPVLSVFEQVLVERTRELELARQQAEHSAQKMQRMALTDSLTGLANRQAFEADLEAAISTARAENTGLAVLSFDLDGLKLLNDSLGHDRGDHFLSSFGQSLVAEFERLGVTYRIGGDEFAVIAPQAPDNQTLQTRIDAAIGRVQAVCAVPVGASSGVARFPDDARSGGDLLRVGDRRMYQDKLCRRSGRAAL